MEHGYTILDYVEAVVKLSNGPRLQQCWSERQERSWLSYVENLGQFWGELRKTQD